MTVCAYCQGTGCKDGVVNGYRCDYCQGTGQAQAKIMATRPPIYAPLPGIPQFVVQADRTPAIEAELRELRARVEALEAVNRARTPS